MQLVELICALLAYMNHQKLSYSTPASLPSQNGGVLCFIEIDSLLRVLDNDIWRC